MCAPGKYSYQFGDVDERDPKQLEAVLGFVEDWVQSEDGFTKSRTRPEGMRKNILARIPPVEAVLAQPGRVEDEEEVWQR